MSDRTPPATAWTGTEETLELPGTWHILRAHRYDQGQVTVEVWNPFTGTDKATQAYMSPMDRRALAKFLMQDLAGDPWFDERSGT